MNKKIIYIITAIVLAVLGVGYAVFGRFESDSYDIIESQSSMDFTELTSSPNMTNSICVYVCGAVNNPGVYNLSDNSRLVDAINLAGGATEEAALDEINLANLLYDGEKIYVPDKNQKFADSNLVNINSASLNVLMTLPGIGESRASSIIEFRENVGGFAKIEDIMKVSGIKESAFAKIKDLICV